MDNSLIKLKDSSEITGTVTAQCSLLFSYGQPHFDFIECCIMAHPVHTVQEEKWCITLLLIRAQ